MRKNAGLQLSKDQLNKVLKQIGKTCPDGYKIIRKTTVKPETTVLAIFYEINPVIGGTKMLHYYQ